MKPQANWVNSGDWVKATKDMPVFAHAPDSGAEQRESSGRVTGSVLDNLCHLDVLGGNVNSNSVGVKRS